MTPKTKDDSKKFKQDLKQVQDQYLDYPYPLRDPEDEKERLLTIQGDSFAEINHYLFNGRQDFSKNFRVLIAGGGTGDAAIYWGEQLRGTNGQIVYLDFSKASMGIAKERAKIRKLKNITWINDSILNIPKMDIGKFDHINCVGVLHHLESPDEGLKALKTALKPTGGMSLMVYAKYGRTGLYQIQDLMKMVNDGETNRQREVENGWGIINALPPTNWWKRGEEMLSDLSHGDIGLYDMFLHKQDRAYSVPEIYEFVSKAGLNFVDFTDPYERAALDIRSFLQPGELLDKIQKMDIIKQQAICEIMAGNIIKHSFWVSNRSDSTVASFDELDNGPFFKDDMTYAQNVVNFLDQNPNVIGTVINFNNLVVFGKSMNLAIMTSEMTKYMFEAIHFRSMTLAEIKKHVAQKLGKEITNENFKAEIERVFVPFAKAGCMYLSHKSASFKVI